MVRLFQREESIGTGQELRVAIVQQVPLPTKSTGIGVSQIASSLLHLFLRRVLGHAGQCYATCLEPSNFCATSFRHQPRIVSGLATCA
jgi:hypothetical protein